jgi:solute carrier family 30 (zinc transporter), member 5/7
MYGVFLHILADTLGSVAVIISSICIDFFDFTLADPICCFLISALILGAAVPFTMQTARTLTLGIAKPNLQKEAFSALDATKNVVACKEVRIWEMS